MIKKLVIVLVGHIIGLDMCIHLIRALFHLFYLAYFTDIVLI